MKRQDLLKSKEYWMVQVQNDLYGAIEEYMKENGLSRTGLANKLGVTKGYITQVLNGDFDHKLSKLVELALAVNKVPVLHFVDLNRYISDDANFKYYELIPTIRPKTMTFKSITNIVREEEKDQPKFSTIRCITTGEKKPVKDFEEVG